ncbi:hypothetical protein RA28_10595 [Ruegeria sp. ANG-S4]|nr:hypothetical protein RA28_10595 [Ruegeria sp. ANG-S4]
MFETETQDLVSLVVCIFTNHRGRLPIHTEKEFVELAHRTLAATNSTRNRTGNQNFFVGGRQSQIFRISEP